MRPPNAVFVPSTVLSGVVLASPTDRAFQALSVFGFLCRAVLRYRAVNHHIRCTRKVESQHFASHIRRSYCAPLQGMLFRPTKRYRSVPFLIRTGFSPALFFRSRFYRLKRSCLRDILKDVFLLKPQCFSDSQNEYRAVQPRVCLYAAAAEREAYCGDFEINIPRRKRRSMLFS